MPLSSMTDIPIVEEGGDVTDVVQEKRDYYLAVSHNQLNLDHEVYNNQSMGTISAWKPLNTQSNVIIPNKKQRVQTAKCGHRRVISLDYQKQIENQVSIPAHSRIYQQVTTLGLQQDPIIDEPAKYSTHNLLKKPPATAHSSIRPMRLQ